MSDIEEIQSFWGYVKEIHADIVIVKIWDKKNEKCETERVFKRGFMRYRGIAKNKRECIGQPIEIRVFRENGKPKITIRALAPNRGTKRFKLIPDLDYSQFKDFNK